ncbi:MAG: SGNH/GDSL hydrolase family protein [Neisseria sp.]|uniref:SGNH/GDSL hydrolase family protein n=1 Tax=Neisseria sp. TaxID=192066 RepID=UPI0026DC653F|nr:SGNH/GDSL hydrolase family protein [Neisseria sp.]MDO4640515.1 SGNH/GDSL hydrolase family protein [Neisseria sp.]
MTIYLIGDSIRLHAEFYIRQALAPLTVASPPENCRSSDILAEHIAEWAPAKSGDIVHLNCGLHDIRHNTGSDQPVNSLAQYQANLRRIFDYLAARRSRVIWATSTPFNQIVHNTVKASHRYDEDIMRYNACSVELATAYGFAVNDLHAVLTSAGYESLLQSDGLHYTEAGSRLIGETIARAIRLQAERPARS